MQNICVGALRWSRPPTPEFCVGDTNMLVCINAKICVTPDPKSKICVTPNVKHKLKSVEYMLRWVPNANFSRWPCTFLFFWCRFHPRWVERSCKGLLNPHDDISLTSFCCILLAPVYCVLLGLGSFLFWLN